MKSLKHSSNSLKPSSRRLESRKMSSSQKNIRSISHPSVSHRSDMPRMSSLKHDSSHAKKHSRSPRPASYSSSAPNRPLAHGSHSSVSVDRGHGSKRMHEYDKRMLPPQSDALSRIPPSNSRLLSKDMLPHTHLNVTRKRSSGSPSMSYPIPMKKKPSSSLDKGLQYLPPERFHSHDLPGPESSSMYSHKRDQGYTSQSRYPLDHPQEGFEVRQRNTSSMDYMPLDHKRSRDSYHMDHSKSYNLTLDERFRGAGQDDQRVQFTKQDLENITVDIKRGFRGSSPTVRRIVDPYDVKMVRRPSEGHRPLFDRDEIKKTSQDLREDAYYDHKLSETSDRKRSGMFVFNKAVDNYEITRNKFGSSHAGHSSNKAYDKLSEKWTGPAEPRSHLDSFVREERPGYSAHSQSSREYSEHHRSKSDDRDFRAGAKSHSRPDYPPHVNKPVHISATDLRHNLEVRRKESSYSGNRMSSKQGNGRGPSFDSHSYPSSKFSSGDKDFIKGKSGSPIRGRRTDYHRSQPYSPDRSSDHGRDRKAKSPDFSDQFEYSSPSYRLPSPIKTDYYNESRSGDSYYSKGGNGFKSTRGFRGRSFRGGSWGTRGGRGTFRGSIGSRGKGFPPKRSYSNSSFNQD